MATTATRQTRVTSKSSSRNGASAAARQDYELPILRARVPEAVGNMAFWAGLAGSVVIGAVELPLAALVGAGVVVARHTRRR
ncbi:MAG: hypothetical protein ACR2KC_06490 [Acidimicrobiales bacterium]